jgi:hypothetical protein
MGLSRAAYNNRIRQASSNAHKWTWLIGVIKAKVTSSPSGQISAAHRRMSCPLRRVREVKSKTAGLRPRSALSAKLWNSGNGINGADEGLRALLIAQTGTPGLRESAVGLELSMKDVGLIVTPKNLWKRKYLSAPRILLYEEGFWPSLDRDGEKKVKTLAFL